MTQFKEGDWVRYYNRKEPFKITKIHNDTKGMKAKWKYVSDQYTYTEDMLEPWTPQPNEWCWFWNKNSLDDYPRLGKYGYLSWTLEYWDHCEPFIGQLPSILKE